MRDPVEVARDLGTTPRDLGVRIREERDGRPGAGVIAFALAEVCAGAKLEGHEATYAMLLAIRMIERIEGESYLDAMLEEVDRKIAEGVLAEVDRKIAEDRARLRGN